MAEIKCPCGLRNYMEEEDCKKTNCNDCCPLTKPQTNADRIRAMSDEELAHWICKRLPSCASETCPGAELCNATDGLSNGLVKWLKQPAEGE